MWCDCSSFPLSTLHISAWQLLILLMFLSVHFSAELPLAIEFLGQMYFTVCLQVQIYVSMKESWGKFEISNCQNPFIYFLYGLRFILFRVMQSVLRCL